MKTRLVRPVQLLALVLALVSCCAVSRAEAAVYWGSGGSIGAVNKDGSMLIDSYPYGNANTIPRGFVTGVAVTGTHLFWADLGNRAIGSMTLSGAPDGRILWNEPKAWIDQALVPNVDRPWGIAVDSGHLYWASTAGAIGRSNLDGTAADRAFIDGLDSPCGLAVDGAYIYWGEIGPDTIGRARLDGSEVEPEFIAGVPDPCGVAVSASHVYWSGEGPNAIGRAQIDGSDPEPAFIPSVGRPCGVAVDSTHVYWTDLFDPGTYLSRANLDGSGAASLAGEQFYAGSCGVALDSRVFQPRLALLSLPISFGPVKRRKGGRLLVLPVYVPEQGNLSLTSPRIGWGLEKGPITSPRWTLELWPGKGRVGKRIRRQLQRRGRARVDLSFNWEQPGRRPITVTRSVVFASPAR